MRIYVASSWRNKKIDGVILRLRDVGHEVYDFREDEGDGAAFNWRDIDPDWKYWTPKQFRDNLNHQLAVNGYYRDKSALDSAEAVILVLPCGRSAHTELGMSVRNKLTGILLVDGEPELMYKAVNYLWIDEAEMVKDLVDEEIKRTRMFSWQSRTISKKRPEDA